MGGRGVGVGGVGGQRKRKLLVSHPGRRCYLAVGFAAYRPHDPSKKIISLHSTRVDVKLSKPKNVSTILAHSEK